MIPHDKLKNIALAFSIKEPFLIDDSSDRNGSLSYSKLKLRDALFRAEFFKN